MTNSIPFRNRAKAAWQVLRHGWARRAQYGSAVLRLGDTKQAPFIWPDFRSGTPQWHLIDLNAYITEGFNANSLIYSAIMFKARSVAQATLRGYTGDPDNPDPLARTAPMAKLLDRPNEHQSQVEFLQQGIVYLNLAGNWYTFLDRPNKNALPAALYNLRPDRVYIIPQNDESKKRKRQLLKGYLYVPEGKSTQDGIPILPEDMVHIKFPYPGDELEGYGEGLSPISPMAMSADVDNEITKFIKLFFENGTMPVGLLSSEFPLTDEDAAEAKERWKEMYGGHENWADIAVMGKGLTYERIGFTFEELGFDALDERNESRILGPFGVPPILIGSRLGLNKATYSNYEQARRAFWEDTLRPEMALVEAEFAHALSSEYLDKVRHISRLQVKCAYCGRDVLEGASCPGCQRIAPFKDYGTCSYCGNPVESGKKCRGCQAKASLRHKAIQAGNEWPAFDFSQVPALQLNVPELAIAAHTLWSMGVPANIALQRVGLNIEDLPDGDVAYVPMGVVPVEQAIAPPAPVPPALAAANTEAAEGETQGGEGETQPEEEEAPKSAALQAKSARSRALWEKADRLARSWEGKFSAAARGQFQRELRALLAIIGDAKAKAVQRKQTVAWEEAVDEADEYLTPDRSGKDWAKAFTPLIAGMMLARTGSEVATYDIPLVPGSVFRDPASLYAADWFAEYVLKFAQPVLDTTREGISALLKQATSDGWSVPETQKHLEEMFLQWMEGDIPDEQFYWLAERMPAYRTEMIARTETMRAANSGAAKLYGEWGMGRKWLATRDDRVRDAHLEADGQTVEIGETFEVGGEKLMYPGDPAGSPGNTINCRCTVAPWKPEWED